MFHNGTLGWFTIKKARCSWILLCKLDVTICYSNANCLHHLRQLASKLSCRWRMMLGYAVTTRRGLAYVHLFFLGNTYICWKLGQIRTTTNLLHAPFTLPCDTGEVSWMQRFRLWPEKTFGVFGAERKWREHFLFSFYQRFLFINTP
jgi:hypothetical protein